MSIFSRSDSALDVLFKAEEAIYKRDFTQAQRKSLAAKGHALPNLSYPIETAADLHPAAVLARSGHGDTAAAKTLIARRAKELGSKDPLEDEKDDDSKIAKAEFAYVVSLRKSDVEGKFYGVVLEPNLPDSQGDEFSPVEIEKSCHEFMRDYSMSKADHSPDVQHSGTDAGADLIENYIAPQDMVVGGEPVTKASWVQAWQINDPLVKAEVDEGKLTGLSLEGLGVRHPVEV